MSETVWVLAVAMLIVCWPAILAAGFLLLCRWSVERAARREHDRRALARSATHPEPLSPEGSAP